MSQQSALERLSEDSIVIAFDYGLKRIGVAVGNLLTKSARPLRIIHWKKNDQKWAEITQVLSDWQPAAVVVGVPRHKDGKPNDMTPICERFANQVEGRYRRKATMTPTMTSPSMMRPPQLFLTNG